MENRICRRSGNDGSWRIADADYRWRSCRRQSKEFSQSQRAPAGRRLKRDPIASRRRRSSFNIGGRLSPKEYTHFCTNSLKPPGRFTHCSEGFIESKYFSFQTSDSFICITESKNGLFSSIEFDSDGANWLNESLLKLRPGKVISRLVLSKCITLLLDGN
ncbi:unnamed protein product [Cuscuta epithymum]|uniref:Uncharacterized protein n=1 Tax=Cuscuta epithymum TaxID=186058 RepID=A0AAV0C1P6_9ASTE|nr:unnamed protein product [Cuscuta epithymum]